MSKTIKAVSSPGDDTTAADEKEADAKSDEFKYAKGIPSGNTLITGTWSAIDSYSGGHAEWQTLVYCEPNFSMDVSITLPPIKRWIAHTGFGRQLLFELAVAPLVDANLARMLSVVFTWVKTEDLSALQKSLPRFFEVITAIPLVRHGSGAGRYINCIQAAVDNVALARGKSGRASGSDSLVLATMNYIWEHLEASPGNLDAKKPTKVTLGTILTERVTEFVGTLTDVRWEGAIPDGTPDVAAYKRTKLIATMVYSLRRIMTDMILSLMMKAKLTGDIVPDNRTWAQFEPDDIFVTHEGIESMILNMVSYAAITEMSEKFKGLSPNEYLAGAINAINRVPHHLLWNLTPLGAIEAAVSLAAMHLGIQAGMDIKLYQEYYSDSMKNIANWVLETQPLRDMAIGLYKSDEAIVYPHVLLNNITAAEVEPVITKLSQWITQCGLYELVDTEKVAALHQVHFTKDENGGNCSVRVASNMANSGTEYLLEVTGANNDVAVLALPTASTMRLNHSSLPLAGSIMNEAFKHLGVALSHYMGTTAVERSEVVFGFMTPLQESELLYSMEAMLHTLQLTEVVERHQVTMKEGVAAFAFSAITVEELANKRYRGIVGRDERMALRYNTNLRHALTDQSAVDLDYITWFCIYAEKLSTKGFVKPHAKLRTVREELSLTPSSSAILLSTQPVGNLMSDVLAPIQLPKSLSDKVKFMGQPFVKLSHAHGIEVDLTEALVKVDYTSWKQYKGLTALKAQLDSLYMRPVGVATHQSIINARWWLDMVRAMESDKELVAILTSQALKHMCQLETSLNLTSFKVALSRHNQCVTYGLDRTQRERARAYIAILFAFYMTSLRCIVKSEEVDKLFAVIADLLTPSTIDLLDPFQTVPTKIGSLR